MADELTPMELYIPAGALAFWCHGQFYTPEQWSRPRAEAEAACDYFVALRNAGRPARPDRPMAAVGLEAVELAMRELDGDPELGTFIGYDPELTAARDKLKRIAGR